MRTVNLYKLLKQSFKICSAVLDLSGKNPRTCTKEIRFFEHLSTDVLPRTIPFWWDNTLS